MVLTRWKTRKAMEARRTPSSTHITCTHTQSPTASNSSHAHDSRRGTLNLHCDADILHIIKRFSRLLLRKPKFQRLVQDIIRDLKANKSVDMAAIAVLQNALGALVLRLLHCATLTAVHAHRDVILPKDVAIHGPRLN